MERLMSAKEIAETYGIEKKTVDKAVRKMCDERKYSVLDLQPYIEEIVKERLEEARNEYHKTEALMQTVMDLGI